MGLTLREQTVLDRHDAGETVVQITRATGLKRRAVQQIIQHFDINLGQDVAREKALRAQTTRLGQLVRQAGGHR